MSEAITRADEVTRRGRSAAYVRNTDSFCYQQIGVDPDIKSHFLFIRPYVLPEKTTGGIFRPDSVVDEQKRLQNVGLVLKKGPTAFAGSFADHHCEEGDWVLYSTMERSPVYMQTDVCKDTCYVVNDENVLMVIPPEDVDAFTSKLR